MVGHDEYPGELAGWGAVHAELARNLLAGLGSAQWRFAITDAHGQLAHRGITPARPIGTSTRSAGCRAIVELQVPAEALHTLAADSTALGGWADVVTDLAHQLQHHTTGPPHCSGDAYRRSPGAVLRRYLEIRDRSCTMIGCRSPARGADKDHTHDHAQGGLTTGPNLGDACRHDHRLKHEGGWTLRQPQPGHFHWTSRLGHRYQRRPPPIIEPLPDPIIGGRPLIPLQIPVDTEWANSEIGEQSPPEPEPDPPPPPVLDPSDDIPPF